jgi:hypothetical protein
MLTTQPLLQKFISCIAKKNFANAQGYLQLAVESKIKDRIKKAKTSFGKKIVKMDKKKDAKDKKKKIPFFMKKDKK